MSAELLGLLEGVLTVRISGKLTQPELAEVQKAAGSIIDQQGKGRFLVIVDDFQGTDKEGDWGDLSFQIRYDPLIEKIAIVGDKRYGELTLLFVGKGFRRVAIEYFQPHELAKARVWLAAGGKNNLQHL
jgi:SpoIIAA-like